MKKLVMIMGLMVMTSILSLAQNKTPEERANLNVKALTKELSLDQNQAKEIKEIRLAVVTKMEELKGNLKGNPEGRKELRKFNEESETKIMSLLTEDQKAKYKVWKEEKKKETKERMSKRAKK